MFEKIIMLVMKVVPRGRYEETNNGYDFEPEEGNCFITVTKDAIEVRIKTMKWVPGSYEPIEGSELYKRIEFQDIRGLTDKERINEISSTIQRILKED
jgi:hypothetical protein